MVQIEKPPVYRLLVIQFGVAVIVAIALLVVTANLITAYSIVVGSLLSIIPNTYFASRVFKYPGALAARQIVNSFYIAETIKFLIAGALFVVVFVSFRIHALPLFIAYVLTQFSQILTPLMLNRAK